MPGVVKLPHRTIVCPSGWIATNVQDDEFNTAKTSFDRAATFMRAGDCVMTERVCRQALKEFPRDANLLCLLGASLIKQKKADEAEIPLSRAVKLFPDFSRAHEGLAEVFILQGQLSGALKYLQRASTLEPGSASIQMKLGKVLTGLGRDDDAGKAFEESFKLTPHREQLVKGLQLQRMGNLREAEHIYRDVLTKDPDDVDALRLLAGLAMRKRQWGDAGVLLQKALEIAPDFFQGWMDLGLAYQEQDRMTEALEALSHAMRLEPERANPYTAAGTVNAMSGRHEEALDLFKKATDKDPGNAGALAGLGHVLKTIGKQEDAIAAYRRCIEHNPSHGEASWSLANLKTFRFEEAEVKAMETQLKSGRLGDEPIANFLFALGKAYEDSQDYDRAFDYYRRGNEVRRQHESYDPVQTIDAHDEFIEVFSREFLSDREGHGHPDDAPIFIVGLPRSGSTLIEQILASHSQVEGTHELPELNRVARSLGGKRSDRKKYPAAIRDIAASQLYELGKDYLRRADRHRQGAVHFFTDKLPNNFVHIGFLSLILPNAKVINARRHPLDSCLGSYKQLFARGQPFTYDLYEVGEFYLQYQRIMDHWYDVLPGKILDVQYEDVVSDLEGQVRRILDHCRLPWEDACLRYYDTDRAVKTASSEQVRKPIYSSSVQLWRNYERHLEPLIEVLDPVLRELPPEWQPHRFTRPS